MDLTELARFSLILVPVGVIGAVVLAFTRCAIAEGVVRLAAWL